MNKIAENCSNVEFFCVIRFLGSKAIFKKGPTALHQRWCYQIGHTHNQSPTPQKLLITRFAHKECSTMDNFLSAYELKKAKLKHFLRKVGVKRSQRVVKYSLKLADLSKNNCFSKR